MLTVRAARSLRVLGRGRLTLYEARGDYQLVLDHLEEAGEGHCGAFRELKPGCSRRLSTSRASVRCRVSTTLSVITSPSGAAVRDVLSVLARRFPLLEVEILPTQVQGRSGGGAVTRW